MATLLILGLLPSAQAQLVQVHGPYITHQFPRESTPATLPLYDLPQPDYEAPGILLGSFQLSPEISDNAAYDDNIFASDVHDVDDFVNLSQETLNLTSQWSRHGLQAQVFSAQQTFAAHSSEDANTYSAQAAGRLDITGDAFLELAAGIIQQPRNRGDIEALAGGPRPIFNTTSGELSYQQTLDRWVERAQASVDQLAYITSADHDFNFVTDRYLDNVTYHLSDSFGLFGEGSYVGQHFVVRPDRRDNHTLTGLAGVTAEIPTVLKAELGLGIARQSFVDSELHALVAPVIHGDLVWNVTPLTSIVGLVDRTITGTRTLVPGEQRRNSLVTTVAEGAVQHEVYHDLLGEIRFHYERDVFDAIDLVDDVYQLKANARYLVNRYLEADFDYTHTTRTANLPFDRSFNSGPYEENVIALTLKARL